MRFACFLMIFLSVFYDPQAHAAAKESYVNQHRFMSPFVAQILQKWQESLAQTPEKADKAQRYEYLGELTSNFLFTYRELHKEYLRQVDGYGRLDAGPLIQKMAKELVRDYHRMLIDNYPSEAGIKTRADISRGEIDAFDKRIELWGFPGDSLSGTDEMEENNDLPD